MLKVRFRRMPREGAGQPCALPRPDVACVPDGLRVAANAAGFTGAAGQVVVLARPEGRVLLVGTGQARHARDWEAAGGAAAAAVGEAVRFTIDARGLAAGAAASLAAGACLRAWAFTRHQRNPAPGLRALDVLADDPDALAPLWDRVSAGVRGCLFARDLVAEPANTLTTRAFAARLEALAEYGISVDVLGRKRLAREGLGGLLAVGQGSGPGGSPSPPRLAVLRWRGSVAAPPVVFVGKGICFDTGGISVKPAAGMEAMKTDMAGAAACAGAMLALALRHSPAPAVAVLALAENALGGGAYRPGDVLRMGSGRSVEVVDTDAEGRLVLADALHYAQRFRPQAMLDLATLTGSVVTALGHHRAGLYGNDAGLLAQAAAAGEAVGEPLWPMPIGTRHREDLNSDIADLKQCAPIGSHGGRLLPDASHAAAFLREFAGSGPWVHLDIAGVGVRAEPAPLGPKGPSGFGARLLDALVSMYFEH